MATQTARQTAPQPFCSALRACSLSELLESFEDGVLTLTFNRPERRNAITQTLFDTLAASIVTAAQDPDVRCLVLTGADGTFCAGGDMSAMPSDEKTPASPEAREKSLRESMEIFRVLHEMPKPTLAIMNGATAGAGLVLALACDMRFCLDTAKITTAFSKIATSGDSGVSYFLPRVVGPAKAIELMFTADVISGLEAFEIGLVTKIAEAENFNAKSTAFARYLASLPTFAIGLMKKNFQVSLTSTLSDTLDIEAKHMIQSLDTDDHKRAVESFLNKVPPTFSGS